MAQTVRPDQVVVVDNSSALDGHEQPPSQRAGYTWHRAEQNLGYGAACNLGALITESDYILFLNADVTLRGDACESLLIAADRSPHVAVLGPRIIAADGGIELSARAFPTLATGIIGRSSVATKLLAVAGHAPSAVTRAHGRSGPVDWVSGACMLVRRRAFTEVDGFDEHYWMYWEDADLCRRLRDAGWRSELCTEAMAFHDTGSSGQTGRTVKAFHDSAARYYERHVASTRASAWLGRRVLRARMRFILWLPSRRTAPVQQPDGHAPGRRILIDALAARYGGTAYAAAELAIHMASLPEVANVAVVTRRGSIVERRLAGVRTVECTVLRDVDRLELVRRVLWEALLLPRLVKTQRVDTVLSMSGMLPRRPGAGLVCMLFNPVMYEQPRSAANRVRRAAARRTARWARDLVVPSAFMANLVHASIGRRCEVVALGVDRALFAPASTAGDEVLCVGDFYAHKRHDLIIHAWLDLPAPRPTLRLIGDSDVDPRAYSLLKARIDALGDGEPVAIESRLSLGALAAAYRRARVFVIASEHESFSMPLAEAMVSGVPAVARDLPSLRETAGDGALYVRGDDTEQWSRAVDELLNDNEVHTCARLAALEVGERYSWERMAERVAAML